MSQHTFLVRTYRATVSFVALFFVLSVSAHAHSHDHDHGAEDAHVHGVASLDVALDGEKLVFLLHAPLADIVGFEHAPSTDAQKAEVLQTKVKLMNEGNLFIPSKAASCLPDLIVLDAPALGWAADNISEHDEIEHENNSDTKIEAQASHADLFAQFQFRCSSTDALEKVQVELFKTFPTLNTINVQTAIGSQQTKQVLNPQAAMIIIKNK